MNAKCFILAIFLWPVTQVGAGATDGKTSFSEASVIEGGALPPVSLGDTCTYEVKEYGVTRIEEEMVVRTHPQEGYTTALSRNGVRIGTPRYSSDGVRLSAPILRYPMNVGSEWETQYSSRLATGSISTSMKGRVNEIRHETIQGRVLLLVRMTFSGSYTEWYVSEGSYGGTIDYTLVYAPEIRCIVRSKRVATSAIGPINVEVVLKSYKNAGENP